MLVSANALNVNSVDASDDFAIYSHLLWHEIPILLNYVEMEMENTTYGESLCEE